MLKRFSAYVMFKNELDTTWKSAQDAVANVLKQKGRQCTHQSLDISSSCVRFFHHFQPCFLCFDCSIFLEDSCLKITIFARSVVVKKKEKLGNPLHFTG